MSIIRGGVGDLVVIDDGRGKRKEEEGGEVRERTERTDKIQQRHSLVCMCENREKEVY